MTILEFIKDIPNMIEWPEATLLIVLLLRKELKGIVEVVKVKMSNASEITIGKDGISIKQIKEILEKNKEETVGLLAQGVGKQKMDSNSIRKYVLEESNDPLKQQWVGALEDRGKRISASVEEMAGTGLYRLKIFVRSTFSQEPLRGKVKFHLHPSFNNPNPVVEATDGEAYLQLVSYGSFTLGAETEDGAKLKLDLATDVPGVSETFKIHDMDCALTTGGFLAYFIITAITTFIGAFGAVMLDSDSRKSAFGFTDFNGIEPKNHIQTTSLPIEWKKKLILAFIAASCTPLVLDISRDDDIICHLVDNLSSLLIYIGHSMILATFGEVVVKKLGELLTQIGSSLKSFISSK